MVVSALREKRAKLAGCIVQLERRLDQRRADLTHIDGVLRLFAPESDPETIRPKRTYRRTRYFARNELSRLCREVLRDGRLLSTDEIAGCVMETKGFDGADSSLRTAVCNQALTTLRALRKREAVEQVGLGRGIKWKLLNNHPIDIFAFE